MKRVMMMKKTFAMSVPMLGLVFGALSLGHTHAVAQSSQRGNVRVIGADRVGGTERTDGTDGTEAYVERWVPDSHTVRRGDTLWDISEHYYGSPWTWPKVWSYNPQIADPHWIYPNDRVHLRSSQGQVLSGGATSTTTATTTNSAARATSRVPVFRRAPEGTVWLRDQGYLDEEALAGSAVITGANEEHMLLGPYDEVYLRFDREDTGQTNTDYTVYQVLDADARDDLAKEAGALVRILGTVRLRSYNAETHVGRGTITEALDPIERGFRVAVLPRRFEVVPPRVNDRDLQASLIATLRSRTMLADAQLAFVDKGREEGVQLGNRFVIVRNEDPWREQDIVDPEDLGASEPNAPELSRYPTEVIAEARVVHVRAHTCTVMFTRAIREVTRGDRVEMREGY